MAKKTQNIWISFIMPYNRKKKIQQKGAVTFSEPFCISWLSVLGREKLDSSPAERDWGDLAQQQTERESTLCPGSQEGQLYPAVHQALQRCELAKGSDCLTLYCMGAALHAACSCGHHGTKRNRAVWMCPKEGYRDDKGSGGEEMWGVAEVPRFVQPTEDEAEGRSRGGLWLSHDGEQKGCSELCSLWQGQGLEERHRAIWEGLVRLRERVCTMAGAGCPGQWAQPTAAGDQGALRYHSQTWGSDSG